MLNAFASGTPSRYRDMTIRDVSHPTPRTQTKAQAVSSVPLPPIPRHRQQFQTKASKVVPPSLDQRCAITIVAQEAVSSVITRRLCEACDNDSTMSPPSTLKYHHTASRLTMPTSASRAKAKPPISQIFPEYYGAT